MPKELTHWILADRALARLSEGSRLREILLNNHDCYLGGAVLPDTLLHLNRGPHATTAACGSSSGAITTATWVERSCRTR